MEPNLLVVQSVAQSVVQTLVSSFGARMSTGGGPPKDQHERGVATQERKKTKRPDRYKVLLYNDDYTSMDFVVSILVGVFGKSPAAATQIMLQRLVTAGFLWARPTPVLVGAWSRSSVDDPGQREYELTVLIQLPFPVDIREIECVTLAIVLRADSVDELSLSEGDPDVAGCQLDERRFLVPFTRGC